MESPTLGAAGLGWRFGVMVWKLLSLLISNKWSFECNPISVEITYGLERICMFTQQQKNVYDLLWNDEGIKYKDVFHQAEKEFSAYNFEYANVERLLKMFDMYEMEAKSLIEKEISLPAYDQCLKASHVFNILDARGAISVAQRAGYISRIRDITKAVAEVWLKNQS